MSRHLTPQELNLTEADLSLKQAVLSDVETRIKEILPALVVAVLKDHLDPWIDETVAVINDHEHQLTSLHKQIVLEGAPDADATETPDES